MSLSLRQDTQSGRSSSPDTTPRLRSSISDLASARRSGGSIAGAAADESSLARSRGSACAALEFG